jgi:C-terminal peptidase (prc)
MKQSYLKKAFFTFITFIFISNFINSQSMEEKQNLQKLAMAYSSITKLYVDDTNDPKIVEDAIKGMLEKLDPHSSYTNAEETRKMNEPLEANFDGIGIQFNMLNDTLYIVQVIPGGPSEKIGLLAGDRIVEVNDTVIAGVNMQNSDIVKHIRGKKGTEVNIKVKRALIDNLIDFKIIRDVIPVYSLDASYMADAKTGYIRLSRFAASSMEEFEKALLNLKKQGMKNLILDLQSNGGGYLHIAYALADQFLETGKLVVYTQGNKTNRSDAISTDKGLFKNGKIVVLVDEYSASASEIVSGAIQDWDRGVIIGRRTYGKGLVQRPVSLPDGSMIRLTVARYYTPSGRNIQKPYEIGNKEAYNHDLIDRYNKGELMYADSVHFPDSLKYSTLVSKRTVYGGGGIMPDIFIPLDSTRSTEYHLKLTRLGVVNKMAMSYLDKNRKEMNKSYSNFKKFNDKFIITDDILNELIEMGKENKIEFNEEQFNKSKKFISLQLKAYIAQNLFDTNEYFQTINEINDNYQKALQIINNDEEYNRIIKGT